jgi:predicted nuclease of predicted toxin-antitoxin system
VKILVDENMASGRLLARLLAAGHDAVLADHVGMAGVNDAHLLAWAVKHDRSVLTRDHEDFAALHDLVQAVGGRHCGICVVRFDNDPKHNMSERAIVTALGNLQSAIPVMTNGIHVLNHWR